MSTIVIPSKLTEETTNTEIADKVLQLTIELVETRQRKKATVAGFNEEIKRIEKEIQSLISDTVEAEEDDTGNLS